MNTAKAANRRSPLVVGIILAATLLTGCASTASPDSDNGNDRPGSKSSAHAAKPRKYVAMNVEDDRHAMLAFRLYPEGSQVIGKYTMVYFDAAGEEVRHTTDFNGRGTDRSFEFDGLTDYGNVKGTLSADRTRLKLDRTFGVEKTQWRIVSSADVYESTVKKYAKRFESCSKKPEPEPCADVY